MTALHHIAAAYRAQAEQLASLDASPEQVSGALESLEGELSDKARAIGFVIRAIEAEAEAEKAWAKQAADKAKSLQNRADSLREYLSGAMRACGLEKVTAPGIALSFRRSEAVNILDASSIPAEYLAPPRPRDPDKVAIKEDLKAGVIIPGAALDVRHTLQIK